MKSLTAVKAVFQPCLNAHCPIGSAVCHCVKLSRTTYGEMRVIEVPAALVMTRGIFASAVSGAIAAAFGEATTPNSRFT